MKTHRRGGKDAKSVPKNGCQQQGLRNNGGFAREPATCPWPPHGKREQGNGARCGPTQSYARDTSSPGSGQVPVCKPLSGCLGLWRPDRFSTEPSAMTSWSPVFMHVILWAYRVAAPNSQARMPCSRQALCTRQVIGDHRRLDDTTLAHVCLTNHSSNPSTSALVSTRGTYMTLAGFSSRCICLICSILPCTATALPRACMRLSKFRY